MATGLRPPLVKDDARVRKIAREHFGFEQLRPGQEEAIVAVLEGRDTPAVMPTGSGKTAICRIPALLLPVRRWWSRR